MFCSLLLAPSSDGVDNPTNGAALTLYIQSFAVSP